MGYNMSTITEITKIVENVYLEVLGRPADLQGLNHWVDRMESPEYPNTKEELVEIFKMSKEYKNRPIVSLMNLNMAQESIVNKLSNINNVLNSITTPEPLKHSKGPVNRAVDIRTLDKKPLKHSKGPVNRA